MLPGCGSGEKGVRSSRLPLPAAWTVDIEGDVEPFNLGTRWLSQVDP